MLLQCLKFTINFNNFISVSIPQAVSAIAIEKLAQGLVDAALDEVSIPQAVSAIAIVKMWRTVGQIDIVMFQYRKR